MACIDDEWARFLTSQSSGNFGGASIIKKQQIEPKIEKISIETLPQQNEPVCEDLYISTKTKVLFLNQPIDINNIFWKIPVIEYCNATDGVVKKQMKIVSKSK
jgi:hypothetical protein